MDLILCHTTADFDTLGAAVGMAYLLPGAKIVLTGGTHPTVRDFLALHKDEYPLIERRAVNAAEIRCLVVVDTQRRSRLGKAAEWLDLALPEIRVYDHHLDIETDIPATRSVIEPVGAATTIIVEQLQQSLINISPAAATVMALGIHVDTGSLTFERATSRDAIALAWLMEHGANLRTIKEYADPGLSTQLQELLTTALQTLSTQTVNGYTIAWVLLPTPGYVPGLSSIATKLMEITETDAIILAAQDTTIAARLTIIGRSRIPSVNLNQLFQPFGGGGHSQAASASLPAQDTAAVLTQLVSNLRSQIPQPPTARDIMSSPVRTIRPETTIEDAQRILLRYGHSGLCVADADGQLVGIISRRDIDIALHHGFSHAPVKGYMTTTLKTIAPETTLPEIQAKMVTYDIGRLPVLAGQLLGIVTRTDVLRELHQIDVRSRNEDEKTPATTSFSHPMRFGSLLRLLRDRLTPPLWELLAQAGELAAQKGWHLYLVGGAVRDLLLASPAGSKLLTDIDLVVDGFHQSSVGVGAGVELAQALQQVYPQARLEIHGAFQTAALLWHKHEVFDSLWIDIATARTEFYPYPAANPEVEASSIRQDLYRRDFTINALAIRLTAPRAGELLDFFGGLLDLQARQIRVLHANSFIEDPTRIYRAVRFAVRLGFTIEPQTEAYIRYCIASGIYRRPHADNKVPALSTRLKSELKYILQADYWQAALRLLAHLGALECIHPQLSLDRQLWWQLRALERCLRRFNAQLTTKDWLLRLEVIIAHLAPEARAVVAENLQLPDESIKRLKLLAPSQTEVMNSLPKCDCPSVVVRLLRQYDLPLLILIALRSPRAVRRLIWQYLTRWAQVQPPLNGNDLKALGYKPGPQYRQILDALLAATLDGVIDTAAPSVRTQAVEFVRANYPRSQPAP